MYSPLYKRILILFSCLSLVVTVVTYRPYKSEAAAGVVVQFAAKQAARALVKGSINKTIGSLALKEATKEVAETMVKKEGFKLIVVEGGKKEMVKTVLSSGEKELLKKNIDKVIDMKIYGNAPNWVKFVDWFIGIGTIVLVADVLYAALTGASQTFLDEIFYEAMRLTNLMIPAIPVPDNLPVNNPTPQPSVVGGSVLTETVDFKETYQFNFNTNYHIARGDMGSSTSFGQYTTSIRLPETISQLAGQTYYVEFASTYPMSSYWNLLTISGMPVQARNNNYSGGIYIGTPPGFDTANTSVNVYKNANSVYSGKVPYDRGAWNAFMGTNWMAVDNAGGGENGQITNYNKIIYSTPRVEGSNVVAYLKLASTYTALPDVVIKWSMAASRFIWTGAGTNSLLTLQYTPMIPWLSNAVKMKVGIYSSTAYIPEIPMPIPGLDQLPRTQSDLLSKDNKLAIPSKTILPEGYTYNPQTQTITDPVGNDVPDPSVIPDKVPDPVVVTDPEGNPVIDDVPVPKPDPEPVPEPDPSDPDDPTPDPSKPEDIQWKKLKTIPTIFTTKFPFSLPWDIERFMTSLFGSVPTVASLKWEIPPLMGIDPDITITIPKYFDSWFAFGRTTVLVMFDISLVYAIYRLLGGAS